MSKPIFLTEEIIEKTKNEFNEYIESGKFTNGKIEFNRILHGGSSKATLNFTEMAWLRMQSLIREFDSEIAWHGLAYRLDAAEGEDASYMITDIMVYPQEVTGATVTTDEAEYTKWLMSIDEEDFENVRMQGHSHVNMGVSPSSTDTANWAKITDQMSDDMFYIFIIWNKKGDKTVNIYDYKLNTLFETKDVTVMIVDDGTGIETFIDEAKALVKERKYTPPVSPINKTYTPASKNDEKEERSYGKKGGKYYGYGGNYSYNYDDYDELWWRDR